MRRIVSLFLLQRLKGSMSVDARFQQHRDASCHQFFFSARQGAKGNLRHSGRNIRGTCTIVCHRQKLGGPVWTWWFFHQWRASSWTTQNSDYPGD